MSCSFRLCPHTRPSQCFTPDNKATSVANELICTYLRFLLAYTEAHATDVTLRDPADVAAFAAQMQKEGGVARKHGVAAPFTATKRLRKTSGAGAGRAKPPRAAAASSGDDGRDSDGGSDGAEWAPAGEKRRRRVQRRIIV